MLMFAAAQSVLRSCTAERPLRRELAGETGGQQLAGQSPSSKRRYGPLCIVLNYAKLAVLAELDALCHGDGRVHLNFA